MTPLFGFEQFPTRPACKLAPSVETDDIQNVNGSLDDRTEHFTFPITAARRGGTGLALADRAAAR